jgi:hypothetical protein
LIWRISLKKFLSWMLKPIVTLPSSVLNEAIEDMDIVSESVTFKVDKNSLTVSASGDLKNADVVIDKDDSVNKLLRMFKRVNIALSI